MDLVTLAAAIGGTGVLSTAGAAGVTAIVGRRLRRAQVKQITAEAHSQIYAAYGDLIGALRGELADTRAELARARGELAECSTRAAQFRAELTELRGRLEHYETREAHLTAEIARLSAVTEQE